MIKQTLTALAVASVVAVGGLVAGSQSAEAGVRVHVYPTFPFGGVDYRHGYYGEYTPRCHWERRRVRRKVCWRNSYGKRRCRWKRRWRRVKICD